MANKYELTDITIIRYGITLYRIRALKDFNDVKKGDLGGYVQGYHNLSQKGNCWIYMWALVLGDAKVKGNALIRDFAIIKGRSVIKGNVIIEDDVVVYGDAVIQDDVRMYDFSVAKDNAFIGGNAVIENRSVIGGRSKVLGNTIIQGGSVVEDDALVGGDAVIQDDAKICKKGKVIGLATIGRNAIISSQEDYIVIQNNNSIGNYLTYTFSNKLWFLGCLYYTSEELIKNAYKYSKLSGDMYSLYVELVKNIEKVRNGN